MNIFYHKSDCAGWQSKFVLAVVKNRTGYYVGYMCEECHVHNRESGYYNTEQEAWSDYHLLEKGLPMTNPRELESEDEQTIRRLKAAGIDPKPDSDEEVDPPLPVKISVGTNGIIDMKMTDPMGEPMHVRIHSSAWGFIMSTTTGFVNIVSDDGFLVLLPPSDHLEESVAGIEISVDEIRKLDTEVDPAAPNIDSASISVI